MLQGMAERDLHMHVDALRKIAVGACACAAAGTAAEIQVHHVFACILGCRMEVLLQVATLATSLTLNVVGAGGMLLAKTRMPNTETHTQRSTTALGVTVPVKKQKNFEKMG